MTMNNPRFQMHVLLAIKSKPNCLDCGCDYPLRPQCGYQITRRPARGKVSAKCIRYLDCLIHGPQAVTSEMVPEYRHGKMIKEEFAICHPIGK